MRKYIIFILFLIIFAIGVLIGNFAFKDTGLCPQKFAYINYSLNCGLKQTIDKSHPIALEKKLALFIESKKTSSEAEIISVYFRDLYNGPTLGINEDETFIGASLLKLPVALTFFKLADDKPDILGRRLHFKGSVNNTEELEQFFKPYKTIQEGSSYTVDELIFNTIVYSDNMSNEVLKASLRSISPDKNLLLETYHDLGLIPSTDIQESNITTRGYASIFRMLYNASYVSLENSEKLLSILSRSDFHQGLTAGVPKNVKVANKFGERFLGGQKQLHDCGIVYYPENPYLLCVMTQGKDFEVLSSIISTISEMVYKEVDSRKIKYQ